MVLYEATIYTKIHTEDNRKTEAIAHDLIDNITTYLHESWGMAQEEMLLTMSDVNIK